MCEIMGYFDEFKTSSIKVYRQTPGYNSSGEVVYVDALIFDGAGWFWVGGDGEQFENQQEKNVSAYSLVLDPADVTTAPEKNDIATIDGVEGYRIGKQYKYFTGDEVLYFEVNKKVGV